MLVCSLIVGDVELRLRFFDSLVTTVNSAAFPSIYTTTHTNPGTKNDNHDSFSY
jgi:hypothetical protein